MREGALEGSEGKDRAGRGSCSPATGSSRRDLIGGGAASSGLSSSSSVGAAGGGAFLLLPLQKAKKLHSVNAYS